jgi:hypothetical protein
MEDYLAKWERELEEANEWIAENGWVHLPKGLRMIIVRGLLVTERDIKLEKES